jgi:hypothetical protein
MGVKIMTTYSPLKTQFSKAFNKVSWSSFFFNEEIWDRDIIHKHDLIIIL